MSNNQNTKHTPGPWVAASTMVYRAGYYVGRSTHRIADTNPCTLSSDTIPHQQCVANAQLIARAPELLAENERLLLRAEKAEAERDRLRAALRAFVGSDAETAPAEGD